MHLHQIFIASGKLAFEKDNSLPVGHVILDRQQQQQLAASLSQAIHGSHKDFALNGLSSHLSTPTNSYIQSKIAVREIDFNTFCFLSLVYLKLASNSLCNQGWP